MSGDWRIASPNNVSDATAVLAEARFIPQRYEPNYPYPLLVLFHGRGGDEHQLIQSMPAMSWRNYVGLGLRGPEPVTRRGRPSGYGWGSTFARPDRLLTNRGPIASDAEILRRVLSGEGPPDPFDTIVEGVFSAVRQLRRSVHVHSERIFLVGVGEGAAVAYRLGLTFPERFAGVVALNGWIPKGFRPLGRLKDCRDLKSLVVHGQWNNRAPISRAQRDVNLLRTAGLNVAFQSYPYGNRLTTPMLSDVDTWLIHQCTGSLL